MSEERTAKEWEEHFRPKGLQLYSYHGFGASYPTQHCYPQGFDTILMTEEEFKTKCMLCSQMGVPHEWMTERGGEEAKE